MAGRLLLLKGACFGEDASGGGATFFVFVAAVAVPVGAAVAAPVAADGDLAVAAGVAAAAGDGGASVAAPIASDDDAAAPVLCAALPLGAPEIPAADASGEAGAETFDEEEGGARKDEEEGADGGVGLLGELSFWPSLGAGRAEEPPLARSFSRASSVRISACKAVISLWRSSASRFTMEFSIALAEGLFSASHLIMKGTGSSGWARVVAMTNRSTIGVAFFCT